MVERNIDKNLFMKGEGNLSVPPAWPDVGMKSSPIFSQSCLKGSPIFSQSCLKGSNSSFYLRNKVFIIAPKLPNIWATFVRSFVTKNFQNWPNLVTCSPPFLPSGKRDKESAFDTLSPVWPYVGDNKVAQMFPKVAQNNIHSSFTLVDLFQNSSKVTHLYGLLL